jgi:hypothetical protein
VDVDTDKLAVTLASRLAAIVPAGFHIDARDGQLWYSYSADEGPLGDYDFGSAATFVGEYFSEYGDTDEERTVAVASGALHQLQDYVAEATTDPWPGRTSMPYPFAQVRDGVLHMWYGGPDIDSPVFLALEPLPLAEVSCSS